MTRAFALRSASRSLRPGFSLLELMLVIAIIGVLLAVVSINVIGGGNKAKLAATKASMKTIVTAIQQYQLEFSSPPPSLQTLITTKHLTQMKLDDGWSSNFYYELQPTNKDRPFRLVSAGEDKQPGNEDDVDWWLINQ